MQLDNGLYVCLTWCLHEYLLENCLSELVYYSNSINCPTIISLHFILCRDTTSEPMAPGPSFYIVYNLICLLFIIITPLVTFTFIPFHHTINRFVFCETGEIDNLGSFNWGKTAAYYIIALSWGHHPTINLRSSLFLAPLPGTLELQQGESHTLNLFTLFCLACFVSRLVYFPVSKFQNPKKLV